MKTERHIVCGGADAPLGIRNSSSTLKLDVWGRNAGAKVTLQIGGLNRKLCANLPRAFHDLLEIATFVFAADQATGRGGKDVDTFGEKWRRSFFFHVPVRMPDLWNTPQVKQVLTGTLGFLSDDSYDFTFYPAMDAPAFQMYLGLNDGNAGPGKVDQAMLFSGGLDSLSGGIKETLIDKRRTLWVSHLPTNKHNRRHKEIDDLMAKKAGALRPSHVLVEINKDSALNKEHTQRTRSFLFAALGAAAARMVELDNLKFYENGVVSLNLPVAEQLIGARATRTTHPRVLKGFTALMTLLAGKPFRVENPFLWETKGDIVERIVRADCGAMITPSVSCAHTWEASLQYPHCGVCSQCIDRRFAVIAAEAEEFDPEENYKLDIFTKSRPKDADKIMGAAYLERAKEFEEMTDWAQMLERYPEITDILPYLDMPMANGAAKILDLHRRHAAEVKRAALVVMGRYVGGMWDQRLDDDCLVRTMYESRGLPSPTTVEGAPTEPAGTGRTIGRLKYFPGFNHILVDEEPYDLRERAQARLCIQYLVENEAFDAESARHFLDEIDPYVRTNGNYPRAAEPKIDHYFVDPTGKLPALRQALIGIVRGEGRYFLKVS